MDYSSKNMYNVQRRVHIIRKNNFKLQVMGLECVVRGLLFKDNKILNLSFENICKEVSFVLLESYKNGYIILLLRINIRKEKCYDIKDKKKIV